MFLGSHRYFEAGIKAYRRGSAIPMSFLVLSSSGSLPSFRNCFSFVPDTFLLALIVDLKNYNNSFVALCCILFLNAISLFCQNLPRINLTETI